LSGALGLVGTKIAFKQEAEEHAVQACKKAGGSFDVQDIQRLKSLQAAMYVEDSQGKKKPLLIRTEPPYVYGPKGAKDGVPTYWGEDEERIDREKNEAFEWAYQNLTRPLEERDCTPVSEVDRQIDEYLESLWEEKPEKGKTVDTFKLPKTEENDEESDAPAQFSIPKGE